jgi:hypothetical protein
MRKKEEEKEKKKKKKKNSCASCSHTCYNMSFASPLAKFT